MKINKKTIKLQTVSNSTEGYEMFLVKLIGTRKSEL